MDKQAKFLLALVLIISASLGGLYLFLNRKNIFQRKPVEMGVPVFPTNPQKGDLGYQESQTSVEIGTKGVTMGTFEKVEAGNIYLREGDKLTQLPLTSDEVVLACTDQDLKSASVLDYDQIKNIKISNSTEIGNLIPANEPAVIFASDVEGVLRVHTVAISSSSCPT